MRKIAFIVASMVLTGCSSMMAADERMAATGHVSTPTPEPEPAIQNIPPVVEQTPIIAAPEPIESVQTFTVVATDLPADELLFALARDARLNLDIDPSIDGRVSINAIDQTLPQILQRISRQVRLRYYIDGPNLVVEVDRPFTRLYRIAYLNMSRQTTSDVGIETALASSSGDEGGSSGDSSAAVSSASNNDFWASIEDNIRLLAADGDVEGVVVSNRETGTVSVQTTSRAHENIQQFIDTVVASARRQVLIEATVVEVTLNDDFQAGVDWSRIAVGNGWSFGQELLDSTTTLGDIPGVGVSGSGPVVAGTYTHNNADRNISGAIKALDAFGEVSVMSSPKIMALNNQTSILKVADNTVYFEVESTGSAVSNGTIIAGVTNTTAKTVPVGFVMNVTPFVSEDGEVILNIRPTITRIIRFVNDPNPDLTIPNLIPEIQVREMESVLRVASGQTAVLGGLMQDSASTNDAGIPGLHDIQGVGALFGTKTREFDKTELVIFLRPRVVDNASLDDSLQDFRKYLTPKAFSQ